MILSIMPYNVTSCKKKNNDTSSPRKVIIKSLVLKAMKYRTLHNLCDKGLYVSVSMRTSRTKETFYIHLCLRTRSKWVTIPPGGRITRIHLAPLGQGRIQSLSGLAQPSLSSDQAWYKAVVQPGT